MIVLYVITHDPCLLNTLGACSESFFQETALRLEIVVATTYNAIDCRKATAVLLDLDSITPGAPFAAMDSLQPKLPILALTANYKQAFCAFKNGSIDVCIKPVAIQQLQKAILKLTAVVNGTNRLIQMGTQMDCYYIHPEELLYLQADDHSVDVYLTDGRVIPIFKTLRYFEQTLSTPFFRIQRSYLVNAMHVHRIQHTKKLLYVRGSKQPLPFSITYTKQVQQLTQWLDQCRF